MIPGFVLLGSHLGDPQRRILSPAQLRELTRRMRSVERPTEKRELTEADFRAMGYGREMSLRLLALLSDRDLLDAYVAWGEKRDCHPLTRGDGHYPLLVRKRLGGESPGCFFYKGDPEILDLPMVSLVGSRDLHPENQKFAREAGRQAAKNGMVLVSGNARGADRAAQEGCLEAGGKVISVVADSLVEKPLRKNILYLSLEDYDAPFSAVRAHSRNWVIHTMGKATLVSQCTLGTGGTWSGTTRNLREGWSPVLCFQDGSPASLELARQGAQLVTLSELADLPGLMEEPVSFFSDAFR